VLIIDDWALSPLTAEQRNDVFEIVEDRYGSRSTIFASQLDAKRYYEYLGAPRDRPPTRRRRPRRKRMWPARYNSRRNRRTVAPT
jgi:DNA replication protein DnaC